MKKARAPPDDRKGKIWEKSKKAIQIWHLVLTKSESVNNFIDSFHIPKGDKDIRMVLNGTSCGLTDSSFSPNLWLSYSSTMTRLLHYGHDFVDLDIGDCFFHLTYTLH